MAANTAPIYTLTPRTTWGSLTAAETANDGTDANDLSLFTAGSNGSFVQKVCFMPRSTSSSQTTNATVLRIYINNGSTHSTASNNTLYREVGAGAISVAVAPASSAAVQSFEVLLNIQLPASYVLYVGLTSLAANTAWAAQAIGGDY